MSELDKGVILEEVSNLPPLLKARALGFMQGIAAATADAASAEETHDTKDGEKHDPDPD